MLSVLEKQILDIKETIEAINDIPVDRDVLLTGWASHINQHYCAKSKTGHPAKLKSVEAAC